LKTFVLMLLVVLSGEIQGRNACDGIAVDHSSGLTPIFTCWGDCEVLMA
jgi:hypothetical protein